jgi:dipeptidyl aminopeptidase/acylaminoacyl peptidase
VLIAVALIIVAAVLLVRVTGVAESIAYYPSREPFATPAIYEDVWITTEDGVRLHAWFMPARNIPPGTPAPAILHVHGNAGNISSHQSFSDFLTLRGFHVLIFDYRNYGRSDPGHTRRPELVRDTRAVLDALLERPNVDPDRVGVLGVSLGAAFALEAAAADPRVRAVATVSAFSSWQAVASDMLPVAGPLLIRPGADPADAAPRLADRPLLIMHGDRDEIIPLPHAARIHAAAEQAGVPAELWTHPEGDHNSFLQTIPEARDRLEQFFRDALGPPTP